MSENPLKQYFRRPSIYIRLPSQGKYYDANVIEMPQNGEIPVYPMTAVDEITSRTPDALFNGQAVVDIMKSCIPCIKDPWKINNVDMDTLLMSIRVASNGETMDITSTCPKCNTEGTYGLNLVGLISDHTKVNYDQSLKIRDLEIKFKPLTYAETNKTNLAQYEIQKMLVALETYEDAEEKRKHTNTAMNRLNEIMSDTYSMAVLSIATPDTIVTDKNFIKEFLNNCDRQTNNIIREKIIEFTENTKLKPFNIRCSNCNHSYDQKLIMNISDFFA